MSYNLKLFKFVLLAVLYCFAFCKTTLAQDQGQSESDTKPILHFVPKSDRKPIPHVPITKEEIIRAAQMKSTRRQTADELKSLDELVSGYNELEQILNQYGQSLRSPDSEASLGALPVDRAAIAEQVRILRERFDVVPVESPLPELRAEFAPSPENSVQELHFASVASALALPINRPPVTSWISGIGDIPATAVSAGHFSNGLKTFVCRAWTESGVRLGYVKENSCRFALDGREGNATIFEVLIGQTTFGNWRKPNPPRFDGAVSTHSIVAGPAYLCRAKIGGSFYGGQALNADACVIAHNGQEQHITSDFEFYYLEAGETGDETSEEPAPSGPARFIYERQPYKYFWGDKENGGVEFSGELTKTYEIGRGFNFHADTRIDGFLLGKSRNLLLAYANVDVPFNQPIKAAGSLQAFGREVWRFDEQDSLLEFHKTPLNHRFEVEVVSATFLVGPIPVTASISVAGQLGLEVEGNIRPTTLHAALTPYGSVNVVTRAAVDLFVIEFGVEGSFLLINKRVTMAGDIELRIDPKLRPVFVRRTRVIENNRILDGSVALFVTYFNPFKLKNQTDRLTIFDWKGRGFDSVILDDEKATVVRF